VQRQDEVGARVVGEGGALGVGRAGVGPPGEQRADADGRQAALEPGGEVLDDRGLLEAVPGGAAVAAAVPGVDDDDLAGQRGAGAVQRLGLAQDLRATAGDLAPELAQRRSVAGPQVPSGTSPYSRCSPRRARSVRVPKTPSARPASKPSSSSRSCRAATSSPTKGRVASDSSRSPSRHRAAASAR
jgi:hypothetical protein